jgi:hypothetical protein
MAVYTSLADPRSGITSGELTVESSDSFPASAGGSLSLSLSLAKRRRLLILARVPRDPPRHAGNPGGASGCDYGVDGNGFAGAEMKGCRQSDRAFSRVGFPPKGCRSA